MPTYDYRCTVCEHEFELFHSIKDKPKKKCPSCGKLKLERLIGTGGAVIFKGGGFYETDYRSESYKKAAKSESEAAKPKSDTTKSDSKTNAKSGSAPSSTKSDSSSGFKSSSSTSSGKAD